MKASLPLNDVTAEPCQCKGWWDSLEIPMANKTIPMKKKNVHVVLDLRKRNLTLNSSHCKHNDTSVAASVEMIVSVCVSAGEVGSRMPEYFELSLIKCSLYESWLPTLQVTKQHESWNKSYMVTGRAQTHSHYVMPEWVQISAAELQSLHPESEN